MSFNIFSLIIGGAFLLYGLYQLWKMIGIIRRQFASASWFLATGTVYDRNIIEQQGRKGGGTFEPEIMYRYTVDGADYEHKISLGTVIFRGGAESTLASVPDMIEVHYNPENPVQHICSEEKVRLGPAFLTLITLLAGAYMLCNGLGLGLGLPGFQFPAGTYHGGGK